MMVGLFLLCPGLISAGCQSNVHRLETQQSHVLCSHHTAKLKQRSESKNKKILCVRNIIDNTIMFLISHQARPLFLSEALPETMQKCRN